MDDYYQYIQPENEKSSENPEDTDVFQNLASSAWGKRLGGLLDTVKKQGEVLVDITKRDLTEFAQTVREDASSATNGISRGLNTLTMTLAPPPSASDPLSDSQVTIKPDDEDDVPSGPKLDKGKGRAIDPPESAATTPASPTTEESGRRASIPAFLSRAIPATPTLSQISEAASTLSGAAAQNARNFAEAIRKAESELASAIPLPKGVTLSELEKELEKGTKWAEGYLQKFGRDLDGIFGDLVVVSGPEDEEVNLKGKGKTRTAGKKIIVDRRQRALTALRQDPSTYISDPANTNPLFATFAAGFDASEYTEEIARLLEDAPEVRTMMEELVPLKIPYDTFWLRYYFAVWRLDEEEARRKKIVRDVTSTEEGEADEFSWGEEEEGEDEEANKKSNNANTASSRSVPPIMSSSITSEDHFSAISAPTSTAPSIVTGSPTSSAAWDDDGSTLLSPVVPVTDATTPVQKRDSTESEFEEVGGQKPEMKERKKDVNAMIGGKPGGKSTKTEENEDWSDWE